MVGARAREIYDRQAKERQREAGEQFHSGSKKVPVNLPEPLKGDSRDLAGKAVSVSGSYIDRATKVIERAESSENFGISMMTAPDYITCADASAAFSGRPTAKMIYRWTTIGIAAPGGTWAFCRSIRVGGRVFVTRRWVAEFMDQHNRPAATMISWGDVAGLFGLIEADDTPGWWTSDRLQF